MQPRVLAVDDESGFLELEQYHLAKHDIEVSTCSSAQQAVDEVRRGEFDAIVSDYMMPGMNGIELLKTLRGDGFDLGFILFTGKGREDVVIDALNGGANYYLQKGVEMTSQFALLARIIRDVCDAEKAEAELVQSENLLRISNKRLDLLGSITRHDIRGEVTIADGYIGLAQEEPDLERARAHLSKARAAIGKIVGIIEVARTYQINGAMNIKWSPLDAALEYARASVDLKGVAFTDTSGDWTILVDPLLEMVCANIFSNSIRHGVHVSEIRVSTQEHPDSLDLIIEDDGIGIAPDQKERIFDFLTPAGIPHGLSIARRILEAEQIEIKETGRHGEGARFVLSFPTTLYKARNDGSDRSNGNRH